MEIHTFSSEERNLFRRSKTRLMIARAIAHKPRLLFMDEATSTLDNKLKKYCCRRV
jgi:ATP-binding cassette subfamily C protein